MPTSDMQNIRPTDIQYSMKRPNIELWQNIHYIRITGRVVVLFNPKTLGLLVKLDSPFSHLFVPSSIDILPLSAITRLFTSVIGGNCLLRNTPFVKSSRGGGIEGGGVVPLFSIASGGEKFLINFSRKYFNCVGRNSPCLIQLTEFRSDLFSYLFGIISSLS